MKKGFTLVELSIVLVIIGLLIGGILVAQSMVSTTRISAQVSQISQFDAAVMNFRTKYNYLGSDAPSFGGDGDSIIDMTAASLYDDRADNHKCELARFWNAIMPDQYARGNCGGGNGTQAISSGENKNVPAAKIGKSGAFFIASGGLDACCTINKSDPQNFYVILDSTQAQTPNYRFTDVSIAGNNSPVHAKDLHALDVKIDDGLAREGFIISGRFSSMVRKSLAPFSQCSTGNNYNLTTDVIGCNPLIRIGGSVRQPQ